MINDSSIEFLLKQSALQLWVKLKYQWNNKITITTQENCVHLIWSIREMCTFFFYEYQFMWGIFFFFFMYTSFTHLAPSKCNCIGKSFLLAVGWFRSFENRDVHVAICFCTCTDVGYTRLGNVNYVITDHDKNITSNFNILLVNDTAWQRTWQPPITSQNLLFPHLIDTSHMLCVVFLMAKEMLPIHMAENDFKLTLDTRLWQGL